MPPLSSPNANSSSFSPSSTPDLPRVFTGGADSSRHLLADLQRSINSASRIDIVVSF